MLTSSSAGVKSACHWCVHASPAELTTLVVVAVVVVVVVVAVVAVAVAVAVVVVDGSRDSDLLYPTPPPPHLPVVTVSTRAPHHAHCVVVVSTHLCVHSHCVVVLLLLLYYSHVSVYVCERLCALVNARVVLVRFFFCFRMPMTCGSMTTFPPTPHHHHHCRHHRRQELWRG